MSPKVDSSPYRCGMCSKLYGVDPNHWFVLLPDTAQGKRQVLVSEWHTGLVDENGAEYACGQAHALMLLSRWLSTGSMEEAQEAKAFAE